QLRGITSNPFAFVPQPVQLTDEVLDVGVGEDAIGQASGPPYRRLGPTTYQDGDRTGRRGPNRDPRQRIHLPGVLERLSAPGLRQDLEDLFHRLAALADVGPEPFEFDGDPSETQSEDQPAFADLADGGGVLGQTDRMMEWRQDDPGADSDPGRDGGKGGADHEERRHVSVVDEVVLGGPHRREVETFRLDRQPDGLFVGSRPALFARTPLSTEQAETEGHGR